MDSIIQYLSNEFKGFKPTNYLKHKIHFVFTTWTCYRRQIMNMEQQYTLEKTAKTLKSQNIYFVLIYSRLDMSLDTEKELVSAFTFRTLCLEDVIPKRFYDHIYSSTLTWMDNVRIIVIKHYDKILRALEIYDFEVDKDNSIMYVDADIEFISNQFPDIYTANGVCSYPQLNPIFTQADVNGDLKDPERAFNYVINGQAYAAARTDYALKKRQYKPSIAYGENCMICVRYRSIDTFKFYVSDYSLSIDFHTDPCRRMLRYSDPLYIENHTFIYLQLVKHLYHRHDLSWTYT
ncbi:hypothetical protein KM759_gp083 [Lymphocystis disease virus 4]|uniref:Uncharacterized protein n=1 Tax=Lymphocystis disease virus 4 TaxID=2704413 RepID=A0A6B9XN03_9VIRU|nr:hypothetical protein KM759_gp083 [Lymphocystis disease virus 4]QHR78492.1 hypothetical protein [Lymphocystis disease virus 4]